MSTSDFIQGQNQGMAIARAASRDANLAVSRAKGAVREWKDYAEGLNSKIAQAELSKLQVEAQLAGRDAQQKILREALREVAPNHPLLREGVLATIGNDAMTSCFSKAGYAYDREKATLRKI
jgi:multidrug resistance efflux pump